MDETRELDTSTFDRGVEMVNDVNTKRIKNSFQFLSFFFFFGAEECKFYVEYGGENYRW